MQVPGRLHRVEAADLQSALDGVGLAGPGGGESDEDARVAQARELVAHGGVVEHAALERRRVDLVEREVIAEQGARLAELAAQRRDREVLDLVLGDVDAPVRRVRVAPLRADGDVGARQAAALQPRGEEGLAAAVGARGVVVAHAALVGRVEHLVGMALHGVDVGVADVVVVAEVDVAGTAEGGETEPQRADGQAGGAERSHGTCTVDADVRVCAMRPSTMAIAFGAGRALIGVALLAAPAPIARGWVGAEGTPAAVLDPLAGCPGPRDRRRPRRGRRRTTAIPTMWLVGGVVADSVDGVFTLAAGDQIPTNGRVATTALAAGSALFGAWLASAID